MRLYFWYYLIFGLLGLIIGYFQFKELWPLVQEGQHCTISNYGTECVPSKIIVPFRDAFPRVILVIESTLFLVIALLIKSLTRLFISVLKIILIISTLLIMPVFWIFILGPSLSFLLEPSLPTGEGAPFFYLFVFYSMVWGTLFLLLIAINFLAFRKLLKAGDLSPDS